MLMRVRSGIQISIGITTHEPQSCVSLSINNVWSIGLDIWSPANHCIPQNSDRGDTKLHVVGILDE